MPSINSNKASTLEDAMDALDQHQMLGGRYKTFDSITSDDEIKTDNDEPASIHVMKHIVRNSIQHLQPYYAHRRHSASRSQSIVSVISPNIGNGTIICEENDQTDNNILLLGKLRERFKCKQLEPLYQRYQQRMMHVGFKAYLHNQIFLCLGYIIILLAANFKEDLSVIIPEVLGQLALFLMVSFFSILACNENLFRRYSWLHCTAAVLISTTLVAVDIALCFWFDGDIVHISATFYTILVVYNLLPLTWIWQSLAVGIVISLTHVLIWIFIVTPSADSNDINSIMADIVFFLSANLIGIFTKCLHEITLRRTFLERRKCIDTTIRCEYEKSREEKLMMSILPKHIASEVREDIREEIQQMLVNHQSTITKKPFEKLYVKKYSNVTILFADIVNFTPLTAILPSAVLVAVLNELFGQFDEAAKATNCLRIKILGDCYNCVSGMPDPDANHAKNCIEMGLKMIEIIKQIREEQQIDVDMRIGVHSGSVISGLLGLRKWQFDIWSHDVTIANHMEQSGIPGKVHVSMTTKVLLGDSFKVEPGEGGKRDSFLAKFEIDTFLILPESHDEADGGRKITFQDTLINPNPRISIAGPSSGYSSRRATNTDSETSTLPLASESTTTTKTASEINDNIDQISDDEQDKLSTCSDPYVRRPSTWTENSYDNKRNNSEGFPRGFIFPIIETPSKKRKKTSVQFGDDQHEEIYSRVTARKISHNVRRSVAAGAAAGKALSKRRSRAVPVDLSLLSFKQMMDQADSKMEHAIETMHLNKFRQASQPEQQEWKIKFCLYFSKWKWELPFLIRKDPLFKLYILGVIPVLLGVAAIQIFLTIHLHVFWTVFGVSLGVAVLVALFLWSPIIRTWIIKISNNFRKNNGEKDLEDNAEETSYVADDGSSSVNEEVTSTIRKPPCWTRLKAIRELLVVRLLIFLVVTVSVGAISVVDLDMVISNSNDTLSKGVSLELCHERDPRIYLWYFTYSCALTMTVIFGFYRIHHLIKLVFYLVAVIFYSLAITAQYFDICTKYDDCFSCKFSPSLQPEIVHILYLVCILIILHVTDRQIEFIHRLDYVWKRKLAKEREEANTTRTVNQLLLLNVLPLHVAEVYLDSRPSDELYHENYKYVAVMFASMPNFTDEYYDKYGDDYGLHCLGVLNQIISEFDALTCEGPFTRIEKIKLIGTTYMAACGLASANNTGPSRKGSTSSIINESSTISSMTAAGVSAEFGSSTGSPLSVLVRFSAAMTTVLGKLNKKLSHNYQLRIGIDYGPAIAGVVGAQKPFYDIWGDTVNMASRLESTGELGKIQVTERTARLIESEGIKCERRGETYLKGKGLVVTHWVHADKSSFYDLLLHSNSSQNLSSMSNESLLFPPIPETTMMNRSPSTSMLGNLSRNRPPAVPEEDEIECENFPELSDTIVHSEILEETRSIISGSDNESITNF